MIKRKSVRILLGTIIMMLVLSFTTSVFAGSGIVIDTHDNEKVTIMNDISLSGVTNGDVVTVLGDTQIDGIIKGDVVSLFGNIKLDGEITGDLVVIGGKVTFSDGARVGKDFVAMGDVIKEGSIFIGGDEANINPLSIDFNIDLIVFIKSISVILFGVVILAVGLLICIFLHNNDSYSKIFETEVIKKVIKGLAVYFILLILLIPLFITIIYPFAFIILIAVAEALSCILIGKAIVGAFSKQKNIYISLVTGLFTVTLIKMLLLSFVTHGSLLFNGLVYILFELFILALGTGILLSFKQNHQRNEDNAVSE